MALIGDARFSTEEQSREGVSLAAQAEKVRLHGELRGLGAVEVAFGRGGLGEVDRPARPGPDPRPARLRRGRRPGRLQARPADPGPGRLVGPCRPPLRPARRPLADERLGVDRQPLSRRADGPQRQERLDEGPLIVGKIAGGVGESSCGISCKTTLLRPPLRLAATSEMGRAGILGATGVADLEIIDPADYPDRDADRRPVRPVRLGWATAKMAGMFGLSAHQDRRIAAEADGMPHRRPPVPILAGGRRMLNDDRRGPCIRPAEVEVAREWRAARGLA